MAIARRASTVLIVSCLLLVNYKSTLFAQAKEYIRTRAGSLAARKGGYPGAETAKVEYYIAPEDKIEVFVWQNPDLSKDVIVGPDGQISLPLAGRIDVTGLTLTQLEERIKEKLSQFVKNPQVSVIMKEFSGNKIVVLGEVNYPGIYTYKGAVNLIEAIALAGDFTQDAHKRSVLVIHGNLVNKPEVKKIDMVKVITRGVTKENITLYPEDVVFVPRTFVSNVNKAMSDIGPLITNVSNMLDIRREIRRIGSHDR